MSCIFSIALFFLPDHLRSGSDPWGQCPAGQRTTAPPFLCMRTCHGQPSRADAGLAVPKACVGEEPGLADLGPAKAALPASFPSESTSERTLQSQETAFPRGPELERSHRKASEISRSGQKCRGLSGQLQSQCFV